MLLSWIRRLADNRYNATQLRRSLRRKAPRLEIETLEERSSPALATWTGNGVPDPPNSGGIGTAPDPDPRWRPTINGGIPNWQTSVGGTQPSNADNIVFPVIPA